MRKYLALIRIGFIDSFASRGNLLYWILIEIISVGITPFIWVAVARAQGGTIADFDIPALVTYFIGVAVIWQIVVTYPFWYLIRDTRQGDLANDLVRPYSYFFKIFFYSLGTRLIRTFFVLPFLLAIGGLLYQYVLIPKTFLQLGMLLVSIPLAYIIIYLLHFLIGTVVFWFDEGFAAAEFFMLSFTIFSGDFAPLTLLPWWLKSAADFLPFQYVLNFPLQIYLGHMDPASFMVHLGRAVAWCLFLWCAYRFIWRRGLGVFSAVGR